jgi:hypothetical protein
VRTLVRRSLALAALAAAVAIPGRATAQRLVGTVVRADSVTPAVRALVEWREGRGALQRTMTDDRGRFTIVLDGAGSVAVRVLRPGFRPHVLPSRPLLATQVDSVRIVLRDEAVALGPVLVEEHQVCGPRGEPVAWQLWEQARVALQSVVQAERDTSLRVEAVEFEADLLAGDSVRIRDSTLVRVGLERPKPRIHYDSLFRFGFIRRVADTSSYFSPTLAVIADDRFAERYCFTRVVDEEERPEWIGVSFSPARRPGPGITDVVGTFWLDRDELLLREVTYTYVNAPVHHRIDGIGGELHFTSLASGHWILYDWDVRMPTLSVSGTPDRTATGRWSTRRTVFRVVHDGVELYRNAAAERLARRAPAAAPPPAPADTSRTVFRP